jgi:hypothetical protein
VYAAKAGKQHHQAVVAAAQLTHPPYSPPQEQPSFIGPPFRSAKDILKSKEPKFSTVDWPVFSAVAAGEQKDPNDSADIGHAQLDAAERQGIVLFGKPMSDDFIFNLWNSIMMMIIN